MKNVLFSGVAAVGFMLMPTSAEANDSAALSAIPLSQSAATTTVIRSNAYVRPYRGFILPTFWRQPTYIIPNYRSYGLTAPSNGYRWSRYYNDAVLIDHRGHVRDHRAGLEWNNGPDRTSDYREPEYGPSMQPDSDAYNWNDDVAFAAPDGSSYSYDGEWDGEYVDPQGKVFEGEWEGRVTRHDGVDGPGYPAGADRDDVFYSGPPDRRESQAYSGPPDRAYSGGYAVPRGYEGYERCLKSNGVTGGVIGAIIGGVAGNRIAGRGDRLGGSLLGAGLGGLAGVAIEKAMDKCKRHHPPARGPYYPPQHHYPQHHGWQGGYYYYPQAPMVTVTVVPGASHTTTTVTEEVYYETVKTYPRKKVVRKWKPKPKPRCICR
jgi:Nickel/cobalt transporter regulator